MRKLGIMLIIGCMGCSSALVRVPAPGQALNVQQASRAVGISKPSGFPFILISQYQQNHARVVILTEPALKLVDMTVSPTQLQVHEQAPHVPTQWIRQWGKLVQAHFLTDCPERRITYRVEGTPHTFELEVTGGICL